MEYTVYEKIEGFPYPLVSETIDECFHDLGMNAREAEEELKNRPDVYNTFWDVTGELRKRKVWIEKF